MKITILGCGGSGGVPMIGDYWGACDPANPKNQRLRSSILIEEGSSTLLIDTSPDLRAQLLREKIQQITAVLFTHAHADHCHGIDDLRGMNWHMKSSIPIYGDETCLQIITSRFDYIFRSMQSPESHYRPALFPHVIHGPLEIPPFKIIPFEQEHGRMKTLGYRIGSFAYSTDCNGFPEASLKHMENLDLWIVDCARRNPLPTFNTHMYLAQTLEWIERVKPKQALLIHMGPDLDYDALCKELPPHIRPAYDGLRITL